MEAGGSSKALILQEPHAERATTPAAPPPSASPAASAPTQPPATLGDEPAPKSKTGSAYFGCSESIPSARLWDETSEGEVLEAIVDAKQCAARNGRRLLLEFVAPWCKDCREMAKLEEAERVTQVMQQRFERVRINVGEWDRHEALRTSYGVRALATYIVIDPKTSKQLAKTTLEPITKQRGKRLTADDWARWLAAH